MTSETDRKVTVNKFLRGICTRLDLGARQFEINLLLHPSSVQENILKVSFFSSIAFATKEQ